LGFLLVVQLRSIIRNETGIESWILRKARDRNHRRSKAFIYPYDLGFKENLRQVFNYRETFNVIGDGLTWPIRDGTDEYALTREQLEQKGEKRQRTVRYEVIQSYKGSFVTFRYGLRTCICIPCSDETRIPIEKGDYVLVTRWEKYWLYGERVLANEMNKKEDVNNRPRRRARGWFPRCCVYEAFRMEDLWSGKIDPDSDIVRAQSENFGPEGFDENGEENNVQVEESQSEDTTSTSASSSTSSNKLKKRKIRQES
jgi:palmitoyltransferase